MKNIIKLSIFLLTSVIIVVPVFAQDCQKVSGKQIEVEKALPLDTNNYQGWQKIELKRFSFYVPKELNSVESDCTDSECYHFKSKDFLLSVDTHIDAYQPSFESKYPSYCEKYIWIDVNKREFFTPYRAYFFDPSDSKKLAFQTSYAAAVISATSLA